MDKNLQKDFVVHKGLALSASVDVNRCEPALISNVATVQAYVIQLARLIGAERLDDCVIRQQGKGADSGMAFVQILDRGLILGEVYIAARAIFTEVMLDGVFDPDEVARFTQQSFDGVTRSKSSRIRK